MAAVLQVNDLAFSYDGALRATIQAFSLAVQPGEIVSIIGPSGCGKTTVLNLIAGLLHPSGGTITVGASQTKLNQVGYILQQDALLPWRTVRKNLALAAEFRRITKHESESRMHSFLEAFHLKRDVLEQFPNQLSGGMRQRVSIIQMLMFDPLLLLLDEPFSALDFFTKLRLEQEFHALIKAQSKGAVLITHDIEEAIAVSDRVLLMDKNGVVTEEVMIFLGPDRKPNIARGNEAFAAYYQRIWSALEANIS